LSDSVLNSDKSELTAVEVYAKHADFIRKVIRSHVKDQNQADDIFQDLFLRLVENPIGPEVEHVQRYLYRVTINEIVSNSRRRKKFAMGVNGYAQNSDIINRQSCPEDPLIDAEESAKTFQFIREQCSQKIIFKREARAIKLYYGKGRRIKEIAGTMGIKCNSASRYVSMGIAKVRKAVTTVGENTL
jgi:RNA polymerase sigma factor (sigma-70 family)